ncbi:YbhN family protein [Streptomyces sp. NPDC057743]|uniref:lysylphosphatidylglycerol synthase transmembrane domain-containing protein n=1 Tax=Streptomyces sp. NPDC057743 TaxID=3346236 RepID=UPI0036C74996
MPDPSEGRATWGESRLVQPGWKAWFGAGLLLAAAAGVAVWRRRELARAFALISRVDLPQLTVAVACEALSIVCLAAVSRWLLGAGGVRWSLRRTTAVVVAANAVAGALPGGAALATAWAFRQLSRRRVGPALAAAVLFCAGALSALGLGILVVTGVLAAGTGGATTAAVVLRPLAGVLGLMLLVGLVLLGLSNSAGTRALARRYWDGVARRHARARAVPQALAQVVEQARSLRPGFRNWLWPAGLALLNWAFDAACLAACLWALGVAVPWPGLLLAYALTQVPGSLRLTPGSLGVVETTLSALLVLYGLPPVAAIGGTLLYRALSYWALQPIGWACWIGVTLDAPRTGRNVPPVPSDKP